MVADVIVFDLDRLRDRATTVHFKAHSVGIDYVLVNGVPALEDGKLTRALPGRVVLRGQEERRASP